MSEEGTNLSTYEVGREGSTWLFTTSHHPIRLTLQNSNSSMRNLVEWLKW
jgi:hypothetical protein